MRKIMLALAGLAAMPVWAQHNYQKAVVITHNNEKLNGWIDFKEWEENPVTFTFASDPGGKNARSYSVKEVKSFEVKGMDYFECFALTKSMDKVAPMEQLSIGPDNAAVKDTVFLRVLRKGRMLNLYSYQDRLKVRYYVQDTRSGEVLELLYKKYYSPKAGSGEKVITDERYRNQLNDIAARHKGVNTAALLEKLQHSYYTRPGITVIVDYLNGSEGKNYQAGRKSNVAFYAGLSLFSSSVKYNGDHELASGADNKVSYMPKISAGIDLFTNPYVKKIIIRMDISASLSRAQLSKPMGDPDAGGYIRHKFDQYNISFNPQVIYNIYNSTKLKVNLGAGLSANCAIYKNNLYEQKYTLPGIGGHYDYEEAVKMNTFWMSVPVRAGVILKERIDIYGQYNIPASSLASFLGYSIWSKGWQVGANILLW